jgi:hypothetical protein
MLHFHIEESSHVTIIRTKPKQNLEKHTPHHVLKIHLAVSTCKVKKIDNNFYFEKQE